MDEFSSTSGRIDQTEFYLPGTFQFGQGPGRIERFLQRVFGSPVGESRSVAGSTGPEFYLPATPDFGPAKSH